MLIKIRFCDAIGPSDCKTNLKQGAHIHQPTVWGLWAVPHACAQPYYPGSGSHGQLFRPYWGSSAWHSRWVNEQGKSPCIKDPSGCSRFDCRHNWGWVLSSSVGIFESVVSGPFKLVSLIEEEIRCLTWTRVVFDTGNTVQSLIFNVKSLHIYNSHYFTSNLAGMIG